MRKEEKGEALREPERKVRSRRWMKGERRQRELAMSTE